MSRRVSVLEKAVADIESGIRFYESAEAGIGAYFRDSILADIRGLELFFGQHNVHFGFHRALASRFPFAIYYRDDKTSRRVVAVLDLRRNPKWLREQLTARKSD